MSGQERQYKKLIIEAVEQIEDVWLLEQIYRSIVCVTKE